MLQVTQASQGKANLGFGNILAGELADGFDTRTDKLPGRFGYAGKGVVVNPGIGRRAACIVQEAFEFAHDPLLIASDLAADILDGRFLFEQSVRNSLRRP